MYGFFFVNYYAAYTSVLLLFIMHGFRILWGHEISGTRVGAFAVLVFITCAFLLPLRVITMDTLRGKTAAVPSHPRAAVAKLLRDIPGQHLVFVPQNGFRHEWVYNAADLDSARIVWARKLGPAEDAELMRRFASRSAWVVSADEFHPSVENCQMANASGVANGVRRTQEEQLNSIHSKSLP
jgi:hypothetical protein